MLKAKQLITVFTITLSSMAWADITVTNASSAYYTGNMDFSPCSSVIGDAGIIKPHASLNIPKAVTDLYCGIKPCEAQIYLSKNCSGKKIATVTVHKDKGVTHIQNYDAEYTISGSGNVAVINGKSKSWLDWLFTSGSR